MNPVTLSTKSWAMEAICTGPMCSAETIDNAIIDFVAMWNIEKGRKRTGGDALIQGARARRHRRRRWRAPAGSRPGARRSAASSMVKGRELRSLYGTKRLVNFSSSRM